MFKSILYRRWDNHVFKIEFEQSGLVCTIKKVTWLKDCSYADAKSGFSYNEITFLLNTDPYGKELDYVKLKKNDPPEEYWFEREAFLYQIELECELHAKPSDAVMVSDINDYMNAIQYYRYIALTVRIMALLKRIGEIGSKDIQNAAKGAIEEIEQDSKLTKISYTITTRFNRGVLDSAVREIKSVIANSIGAFVSSHRTSCQEQQLCKAIDHSISLYEKGENFLYYRGVGHIVYPELPGSLRGNNRFFEDQYYKLAKTTHPDELANLSYLDRIAKIQHYGWPSRLMDVTSNPLVALYMACNTIYSTDDPQQKDMGEIIIYFRDELAEKSYDSKSVLISAALVKLAYQERKAMFEFINMHHWYFECEQNKIGIKPHRLKDVLNLCLRIAVKRGCDTYLTKEEEQQIIEYVANGKIDFSNCKRPVDYVYRCIQGQTGREKIKRHGAGEDQRMRYFSNGIAPKDKTQIYPYVYTEDINFEVYEQLFQYFVTAYDRLLVTIRRENIAFENKIDIFTMLRSYHVRLGMTNDRILAQAGSFIIAGLDDVYINEEMASSRREPFARIIIEDKKALFEELKLLNINDSTMLPDLQNTGAYTRKMFG